MSRLEGGEAARTAQVVWGRRVSGLVVAPLLKTLTKLNGLVSPRGHALVLGSRSYGAADSHGWWSLRFRVVSWSSLGLVSPYYGAFESGGHGRIALERMQRADELGVCGEGLA